jgi:hemoglobin/transferrin/lactoferrin receptor protein
VGATGRTQSDYKDGHGNVVVNSHVNTTTEIGKFNLRPADGHELKFSGLHYESKYESGLPNATKTATVYATDVVNDIAGARWRYSRPDDRVFNFDINTYWTQTETVQTKTQGTNSAISGALGVPRSFHIETVGVDAHNTSRFDAGPFQNALTVGVDAFRDQVNVIDPTGTGDFFTPSGERTVSGTFAQLKAKYRAGSRSSVRPAMTATSSAARTAGAAPATASPLRSRSASRRSRGSPPTGLMRRAIGRRR